MLTFCHKTVEFRDINIQFLKHNIFTVRNPLLQIKVGRLQNNCSMEVSVISCSVCVI